MKLITFLIAVLMFTSCLTVRKIERNCDKFAKVCVTETVKEIVYRDTTIYVTDTIIVELPVTDTVHVTDTIKIRSGAAFLPFKHYEKGIIGVDVGVQWSVIKLDAYLTDSTILQPVLDTIFLENVIREEAITDTVVVEKKFIPKFYKFTFRFFIVFCVLLFTYLFIKLFLPKIPKL